jgi:hypothetical protein
MKLIKSIYIDSKSNEWIIEQCSLSKIKGSYKFYVAECTALSKSFRADLKKQVFEQIKLFIKK